MPTLQQIRDALLDRNLTRVSEASGIPYHVLTRLMSGADCGYEAGRTIVLYLQQQAEQIKAPVAGE